MTIKDIAQISGYGVGTVSRVINNHPDVSDKARKCILEVVEQYGFEPNSNAKHLKMQASSSIIIIVKGTANLLFADLVEKLQDRFTLMEENTSIYYLDEDANEVERARQLCKTRNPKGIVFLGGNLEFFASGYENMKIPSILITNNASRLQIPSLSSITTCDEDAALAAVDHLAANGHTRIGVIGGDISGDQISRRRLEGAERGFEKNKLSFDETKQYVSGRFSMDSGYQAARRLLTDNPELTAIFAMGDVIALGAMRAIYDMGKRVPEDVCIIGYDGIQLAEYSHPRLTTIRQDTELMAIRGADILLSRIHHARDAVHETVPFQLVKGESVICIQEGGCGSTEKD